MRRLCLVTAALFVFSACPTVLVPAPGATRSSRDRDYAISRVAGVRLWASGNEWRFSPEDLTDVLTPIAVTIENRSGFKVRLTTKDFSLVGDSGFRYAALPPLPNQQQQAPRSEATGSSVEMIAAEYRQAMPARGVPYRGAPSPHRFWVAPHGYGFSGFPVWPNGWPWWDNGSYQRWSSNWPQTLPSTDMLQRALPDGVLDDGGRISGFVYFQHLERERAVDLEFEIHDAESGDLLGTARVPFDIHR